MKAEVRAGMRVVIAHPSGNQFFRQLARGLGQAGALAEACTCIDWQPDGLLARRLPRGLGAELARRDFSRSLGLRVATHAWKEWGRLVAGRLGWSGWTRHETGWLSVDAVYRDFDRWVGRRLGGVAADAVYAYEDAAEATLAAAARRGWRRIYDLPIAYWETSHKLLAEEAERWPEWEPTLEATRNSAAKCERKSRELELAEVVVCPSGFVAESVPRREGRQVIVAPFGSPPPGADRAGRSGTGPLRVLFAGSMSQRKGLADLFEAVRRVGRRDVELVVLGSPVAAPGFYRRIHGGFIHERPRPHAAVLELMRTCDVLCLPSIVEGRALVVQEAMSQGLPVIVTHNTGTDDVVDEGRNGFLVPIRDPATLAERLAWCADHRAELAEMGGEAQRSVARVTWTRYVAAVLEAIGVAAPEATAVPTGGGRR